MVALETFTDFLRHATLLGLLNILIAVILIPAGIVTLIVDRSRKSMYRLIVIAMLPFLMGLTTLYVDNRVLDRGIGMFGRLRPEAIAAGRREALVSTAIGITTAALLVLMGMLGLRNRLDERRP